MNLHEQIRAALSGHRIGLNAGEIRTAANLTDAPRCMRALVAMRKRGEIIAHAGDTPRKTRYTLSPDYAPDAPQTAKEPRNKKARRAAPPQRRKKTRRGKTKRAVAKRAAPVATVEPSVLPAMAAGRRLVLFRGGADPMLFSPAESAAIADVVFENYTAE